ncbi:hypothetical protein TNCV_1572341 [Trichonephila clavipes]|uniref:Uncharacterized protein n=1 Tax=Trichonephila clavipes TaxID=2585209 RepID=A0A8X6SZ24_TRICX|nr:hypothetical protein TNCV_1572341 [Trichonephila clavipes]
MTDCLSNGEAAFHVCVGCETSMIALSRVARGSFLIGRCVNVVASVPGMNKIRKTPAGLDCPTVLLSEEFIGVDDDNVCTAKTMADKDILEFVQSSKNIIDADSVGENEMNNAAPVLTSSKM